MRGSVAGALLGGGLLVCALAGCGGAPTHDAPARASRPIDAASGIAHGVTLQHQVSADAARAGLVDQRGRTVTLRSLRGRIVVVGPLLSGCPADAEAATRQLQGAARSAVQAQIADRVTVLELATSPAGRRLRLTAARRAPSNWLLASGGPVEVAGVWRGLGLRPSCHRPAVAVLDPAGRVRWRDSGRPGIDWTTDTLDEAVAYVYG